MNVASVAPLVQCQLIQLRESVARVRLPANYREQSEIFRESQREYIEILNQFVLDNAVNIGPEQYFQFRHDLADLQDSVNRLCQGGEA